MAFHLLDDFDETLGRLDADAEITPEPPAREEPLTEQAVLRLLAQASPPKLSTSTANKHITSIFHKLAVDTWAQTVAAQRSLV